MLQDRVEFIAQNGGSIVFKTWGYSDRLMGGSLGALQLGREELRLGRSDAFGLFWGVPGRLHTLDDLHLSGDLDEQSFLALFLGA